MFKINKLIERIEWCENELKYQNELKAYIESGKLLKKKHRGKRLPVINKNHLK